MLTDKDQHLRPECAAVSSSAYQCSHPESLLNDPDDVVRRFIQRLKRSRTAL